MNEARTSWNESADAWIRLMRSDPANRLGLIDPVLLRIVEECDPRTILDLGCGEGRFSRLLAGREVTGLDPTGAFLRTARELDPGRPYVQGLGETLPFRSDSFDMVVCYLVLLDIPDYRTAIQEMARVVRPGGWVLTSNLNGYATAAPEGWMRDASGRRLHLPMGRYNDEIAHRVEWSDISIINYHRPLQDYMQAFLGAGLELREFLEPRPTAEALERWPSLAAEDDIPLFNVMLWQRR